MGRTPQVKKRRNEGEKVLNVKGVGRFRKIIVSMLGCTTLVATGVVNVGALAEKAYADDAGAEIPTYTLNNKADFMITRVVPASSTIDLVFSRQDTTINRKSQYFNAWQGPLTDYELYSLKFANVPDRQMVFKGFMHNITNNFRENSVMTLTSAKLAPGANLMNTYEIDYAVSYDNGDIERVRMNYGRCAKSSVFLSGAATECRMEDLGNGKVQFQPYTAGGVRVEIPADEDARLSAEDEAWRAEPGWPEGYWDPIVPEEPVEPGCEGDDCPCEGDDCPCEGDDCPCEGDDCSSGGDGTDGGGDDGGDDSGDGDDTGGSGSGSVDAGGVDDGANDGAGNIENSKNSGNVVSDNSVNGNSIATLNSVNENNTSKNGVSEGNVSDGFWETVAMGGAGVYAYDNANNNGDAFSDGNDTLNNGDNIANDDAKNADNASNDKTDSDGDDVVVPNLSKERGGWSEIWQPLLYTLVAAAAIFGWFFLFFGKRKKDKEEKGEEGSRDV